MIINQYQIKTKGEDKMKEKQGYKIVDIKWDTDGDKALFDSLPQEIILPEQFCTEDKDDYDYLDEVSEWLSDEYGYCQSGFRIQKTVSLKEWLMMQFNYCNAIASDILEHNKSKETQEYAKQFAEIESPLVGGTDEKWICINWGDIYIYLYDDGSIRYQLDPLGGYGSELIDTFDSKSFTAEILTLKTAPVIRNNVVCYEEETGYPDDIPMYIPMK